MEKIKHHSVGFIVFLQENLVSNSKEQRKYLLLKYPEGHIDFVKGHIEETDENKLETARRELLEETGISKIDVVDNYFESMTYTYIRNNQKHDKIVDYYLGEVYTDKVKVSHEHTGFMWLTFEEAMKTLTFKNAQDLLFLAENFLNRL